MKEQAYITMMLELINFNSVPFGNNNKQLVRVTILDSCGKILCDDYIKEVYLRNKDHEYYKKNYSTKLKNAIDEATVKTKVANILNGNILIGYDLNECLKILDLFHPEDKQRDLAIYPPLMDDGKQVPLNILAEKHLDRKMCSNSLESAHACMDLYIMFAQQWERNC